MRNYQNAKLQELTTAIQCLAFLHSPDMETFFAETAVDTFDIDWYNCSKEEANGLSMLLKMAKMVSPLMQSMPEMAAILSSTAIQGFDNIVKHLAPYEFLLEKLTNRQLTESQIETELVKVSMLFRRKNMYHLYQNL